MTEKGISEPEARSTETFQTEMQKVNERNRTEHVRTVGQQQKVYNTRKRKKTEQRNI